jgi:hypothetical protein
MYALQRCPVYSHALLMAEYIPEMTDWSLLILPSAQDANYASMPVHMAPYILTMNSSLRKNAQDALIFWIEAGRLKSLGVLTHA